VPQPTAPPRAPMATLSTMIMLTYCTTANKITVKSDRMFAKVDEGRCNPRLENLRQHSQPNSPT
jgi:hypothetical protein